MTESGLETNRMCEAVGGAAPGSPFKECTMCGARWASPESFLSDPQVQFLGYQQYPLQETPGALLFDHLHCGTTMGISLEKFAGLAEAAVVQDSCAVRGVQCDYCLAGKEQGTCPDRCPCSFVAHSTMLIKSWRKEPAINNSRSS